MKKIHYAYAGEWGSPKVRCNKYWSTDVLHTEIKKEVTCIHCLKDLK